MMMTHPLLHGLLHITNARCIYCLQLSLASRREIYIFISYIQSFSPRTGTQGGLEETLKKVLIIKRQTLKFN